MQIHPHISVTTSLTIILAIAVFVGGGYIIFHEENQNKLNDSLLKSISQGERRPIEVITSDLGKAEERLKMETAKLDELKMEVVVNNEKTVGVQAESTQGALPAGQVSAQVEGQTSQENKQVKNNYTQTSSIAIQNQQEIVVRYQNLVDRLQTELIQAQIQAQTENPQNPYFSELFTDGSYQLIIPDFYNPYQNTATSGKPRLIQGTNMVY